MSGSPSVDRHWFIHPVPGEIRLRCSYTRKGKEIEQFVVQLEAYHAEMWRPIVRYDNAHGFCHRDLLHPDGSQVREAVAVGSVNETFTYAIEDFRANWASYRHAYLGGFSA